MTRSHRCRCGRPADAVGSLLLLKGRRGHDAGDRVPFGICFPCLDSLKVEVSPDDHDGALLRLARRL